MKKLVIAVLFNERKKRQTDRMYEMQEKKNERKKRAREGEC